MNEIFLIFFMGLIFFGVLIPLACTSGDSDQAAKDIQDIKKDIATIKASLLDSKKRR